MKTMKTLHGSPLVIQELGDIYTTPAQVAQYLRDNAVQQATPDPNNTWGHGFAELPARPAAPGSPTVEARAGGVLVSWNRVPRPTDTDPVVEGYRLEFRRKSITGTGDWSDYELLAMLTDATSFSHTTTTETHPFDVAYRSQYRVRARPAGHWSSAFPVGGFIMPPSAPQNPTATAANGEVTLNWDAPASMGAGSALDGYEYRQSADGGTTWVPDWTDLGFTAMTTLADLSSCATYTFQVRARIEPVTGTEVSGPAAEITNLRPAWSGRLASNETWSHQVCVEGDVTVASGSTLSLAQGTEVRFDAGRDKTAGGDDAHRSELIVQGTLEASAGGITFRSSNDDPSSPEWYGIRVEDEGTATLTNVTVRDGVHCAKAQGTGTLTSSGVMLPNCGTSPRVTGNQAPEYAEHGDDTEAIYATVADYTAEDAEEDAVLWELEGADRERFSISSVGMLGFKSSEPGPDFEAPAGSQGNTYEVTVRAVDSQQAVTDYPVTVMVTNVDEMGRVDLSPAPPRVDEGLTATLSDPDGRVSSTDWLWQGRAPEATAWTAVSDPAPSTGSESLQRSTYKPLADHVGWVLRAVVDPYEDGHGPGKRAVSGETAPVRANGPTKPRDFTADPGDRRVTLSWKAPASNRGAAITGYAYRYTRDETIADETSWTAGTLGVTTRHLITGLDNGTPYTFQLWALNPAAGDAAPAQATPAGPFTLAAAGRDEYVSLSWTPAPVSGPPVRYYSYRRSNDGGSTWTRWSSMWARLPGYPADPLFYQVQNLTNDVEYLFELRAFNANGQVGEASAPATPTATPGDEIQLLRVSYGADSYRATEGDSVAVEVRLSPAADRAVEIPITVTADAGTESGDYRVSGLSPGDTLPFAENSASETFHVVALPDPDADDETVTLGFGPKPPGVLAGTTSSTTVTLADTTGTSGPLTISGPASVCYDKDRTDAVARYEALDGQANPVPSAAWIPSGVDAGAFGVTAGVLRFDPGPSFEDPTDDGADNVYNVSLRAEEGARRSDLFPVAVSVVNADEGVLTLSPDPPVVGRTLRATLVDLDGGATNFRWQWTASSGARYSLVADSYTPEASDAGQTLTVTVTYDDRCAFDNTLSVTSQPVESPPADTPDLVVGAPSVTDSRPAAGASFTLRATVRNQGTGSSAATTLRYYRSTDGTIATGDTQVGTDEVSALAASGTSAESIALTAAGELPGDHVLVPGQAETGPGPGPGGYRTPSRDGRSGRPPGAPRSRSRRARRRRTRTAGQSPSP